MTIRILLACFVICGISPIYGEAEEEFACAKGETFIENECNFCLCSKGSLGICTKMVWWVANEGPNRTKRGTQNKYLLSEWSESLKECNIGSTWTKKCNKCWCVKDVGQVCKDKKCKEKKVMKMIENNTEKTLNP